MRARKPLIGIPADRKLLGHHYFHCVGEKYLHAVAEGADAIPVLIPSLGEGLELDDFVQQLDGLLLPGSPSNVEPHHYKGDPSEPGTLHDPHRDATTLPLIPKIVSAGLPLLAICRGFQEVNVAYGGTLWQKVHEVPGFRDHREDLTADVDVQYGPAHEVSLQPEGLLRRLAGSDKLKVNSLHWQGVRDLAPGLDVEARAEDGIVEAFSVRGAPNFAVAVQWHPEWKFKNNPFSCALFAAFGEAARVCAARRSS
jgi:putative glutamine amidotransferase